MKIFFLFLLLLSTRSVAQVLVFADHNKKVEPMNIAMMTFVAETLHSNKPALYLGCDVRVREIKQERKFSDGVHIVEMLEIIFRHGAYGWPEEKFYMPVGSVLTKSDKLSKFSGPVEEIQLEANDLANSRFIFQHDGRGEIVWMSFEDDFKTLPCVLKK